MTLYEALEIFGTNTIYDARKNLEKSYNSRGGGSFVKNNTGSLSKSLGYKIVQTGKQDLDIEWEMNDYGYVVDKGRLPGNWVPLQPLRDWLKSKGLKEGYAKVISKNIKEHGIAPTFFFTNPFNEYNEQNTQDILNEVDFLSLDDLTDMDELLDSLDEELKDVIVTGRK